VRCAALLNGWRLQAVTYLLRISVKKDVKVRVGSLGTVYFKKGAYLYVGSARRNLKSRIKRHLSGKKRVFWHIDYLTSLKFVQIKEILVNTENKECETAEALIKTGCRFIEGFGCSDCDCGSHLFFIEEDITQVKNRLEGEGFENADKSSF